MTITPHPPHFHVRYGDAKARVAISDSSLISGDLPPNALKLVRQWAEMHRQELRTAWEQAANGLQPGKIEPLE